MLFKTSGIVLGSTKYSETSLITKIYTTSFGLQSYIVKGARAGKNRKASFFQPLNILNLEVYHKAGKGLNFLKDFSMDYISKSLRFDMTKSAIAVFMLEIMNAVIREEESNEELYDFLEGEIVKLDSTPTDSNFHLKFLLDLTKYLGFHPGEIPADSRCFDLLEGSFVTETPVHQYILPAELSAILKEISQGKKVQLSAAGRAALLEKLLLFYQLHISDFKTVKSHKVLREVLAV